MIGNKNSKCARRRLPTWLVSAVALGPFLSASAADAQNDDPYAAATAAPGTRSAAAPADVSGTVLSIDEEDIVLDLGSQKGATEGAIVELWRPFKLRHPVTGRTLTDRFRIGSLRLMQVQRTLALARPEGPLARTPASGDVAILAHAAPRQAVSSSVAATPSAPGASKSTAKTPTPVGASGSPTAAPRVSESPDGERLDPEGRELCALFESLKGEPIAKRVRRYEQYLQAHPSGTYSRVLWEEAAALRQLLTGSSAGPSQDASGSPDAVFTPPSSARANEPITIGVEIPDVAGAVLHVRHAGEVAYRTLPMKTAGARYYRATVAAEEMQAPEVEYFIESVDAKGAATAAVGAATAPQRMDVQEGPHPVPPSRPAASAAIYTDYADYNRLRGNDYAWQTEGIFALRYADKGVRAVRTGFGAYRGAGGSVYELDTLGLAPRKVGLTYGYLEGEYAPSPVIGLIARLAFGLTADGVNGGGQLFLRLGNDRLTNILLGGEVLGGIGTRGIAELQWNTLPRVPIVLRTEVTNQPAGSTSSSSTPADGTTAEGKGDIGARAMVQVGYRIVPELTLALRASYEGRTIQHSGPGAGAGVMYSW
jgi:hypothetical protein